MPDTENQGEPQAPVEQALPDPRQLTLDSRVIPSPAAQLLLELPAPTD